MSAVTLGGWRRAVDWRDGAAMSGLLLFCLAMMWWLGELISAGGGFGFGDGRTYGRLGMSFPDFKYVDEYRMGRVLPALAVNLGHRLLPGTTTVGVTITLFRILNVALLVGSAWLWYSIARRWALTRAAAWIGFVGLFLSFANLKLALYYPTLTDTTAFATAVLLLYVFLRGGWLLTAGVAAAGAFISPPLALIALVLTVFPKAATARASRISRLGARIAWSGAATLGIVLLGWLWSIDARLDGVVVANGEQAWRGWMWLSIAAAAGYVVLGTRPLLAALAADGWSWLKRLVAAASARRSLILRLGAVFLIVATAVALYQLGLETERTSGLIVERMLYSAVARPFAFAVAHFAHYGPIVILAALVWSQVAAHVHEEGLGLVVVFLGILVLSLTSESRTITAVVPFVVAFTARAVDRFAWRPSVVLAFTGLSLVVSRFWYPLNQGPLEDAQYLEFPAQAYFMNFGPWLANGVFLIFAVVFAVSVGMTVLLLHRTQRSPDTGLAKGVDH